MLAGIVAPVGAYSAVPVAIQTLAELSSCVASGTVARSDPRRVGAGYFTTYTLTDVSSVGDCPLDGDSVVFSLYGGHVAAHEGIVVAGISYPQIGDRLVVLLEPVAGDASAARVWLPVEGPQGVFQVKLLTTETAIATDATGMTIGSVTAVDAATGLAGYGKRVVSAIERRIRAADGQKAHEKWFFDDQIKLNTFIESLANVVRTTSVDSRSARRGNLRTELHGRGDLIAREPLPTAVADFTEPLTRTVAVDCTANPLAEPQSNGVRCPGATPRAAVSGAEAAKYTLIDNGDRLWNPYPSTFGSYYQVDQSLMAEWNKYADHFRVLTTPTGSYGKNGYNDMGGFPSSASLQSMYAYTWGSSTLGVTLTSTYCLEWTIEYFLGIEINRYCSNWSHESDVFLNPSYTFSLDDRSVRHNLVSGNSSREVIFHELGHGFGLGHSTDAAVMQPYNTGLGWHPWPDDATGARAKWPPKARYEKNVAIRAVSVSGPATARAMSSTYAFQSGATLRISSYVLNNFNNTTETNFPIEWYLTDSPGSFAGTYTYITTTTTASVPSGLNQYSGPVLPLPPGYTGRWYITAYIRSAGTTSSPSDGSSDSINIVYIDDYGNTPAAAYSAPINGSLSGVVGIAGDEDWFRFVTPSTGRLALGSTGSTDTTGTLYASDGITQIAFSDDDPAPNFALSRLLPTGTYYLRVGHYFATGVGIYGLTSSFAPQGCTLSMSGATPNATVDGRTILRFMLGISAPTLGLSSDQGDLASAMLIDRHWDIDGDGVVTAARDGVILLRALLGFKGAAVTQGVNLTGATRGVWMAPTAATASNSIRLYLNERCAGTFAP